MEGGEFETVSKGDANETAGILKKISQNQKKDAALRAKALQRQDLQDSRSGGRATRPTTQGCK
jgi:hypothetical protein